MEMLGESCLGAVSIEVGNEGTLRKNQSKVGGRLSHFLLFDHHEVSHPCSNTAVRSQDKR